MKHAITSQLHYIPKPKGKGGKPDFHRNVFPDWVEERLKLGNLSKYIINEVGSDNNQKHMLVVLGTVVPSCP